MRKVLFTIVFAATFFAGATHAAITLTIAGFNPTSAAASAPQSAKKKGMADKREKSKKMASSKKTNLTRSKNGAGATSQNATLPVISADFAAGSGGSSGRATGPGGNEGYVITRNMDGQSGAIANAAQTNRVYTSAVIANSSGPNINLNSVYFSSYSTSMSGSSSVETFKVHFQSQSVN